MKKVITAALTLVSCIAFAAHPFYDEAKLDSPSVTSGKGSAGFFSLDSCSDSPTKLDDARACKELSEVKLLTNDRVYMVQLSNVAKGTWGNKTTVYNKETGTRLGFEYRDVTSRRLDEAVKGYDVERRRVLISPKGVPQMRSTADSVLLGKESVRPTEPLSNHLQRLDELRVVQHQHVKKHLDMAATEDAPNSAQLEILENLNEVHDTQEFRNVMRIAQANTKILSIDRVSIRHTEDLPRHYKEKIRVGIDSRWGVIASVTCERRWVAAGPARQDVLALASSGTRKLIKKGLSVIELDVPGVMHTPAQAPDELICKLER